MNDITYESIIPLIYKVEVNEDSVSCHFICPRIHKEVISIVPLVPMKVEYDLGFVDLLMHPIRSWQRMRQKERLIYGTAVENSLVVEAFQKIASHFKWNSQYNSFVYE
ncbi:MAG TPA: hypothetical protein ENK65_00395 [Helicobacteraceae bacterium]|nr:hypothetical protein [Helicobacteraceae bacterium]